MRRNVENRKSLNKTIRDIYYVFLSTFDYWKNNKKSLIFIKFFLFMCISFLDDYLFKIRNKNKLLSLLIKRNQTILTSFGKFEISCIGDLLILHKYYEYKLREVIEKNISEFKKEKEKIFIDIGAHIGRYVIELNKKNYYTFGFEPSKKTFKELKYNLKMSKIEKNFTLYNFGLGSKNKKFYMLENKEQKENNRIILKGRKGNVINTYKFDDKVKINSKKTRLILIDVEGFEIHVLKGMKNFIKKLKKVDILIESDEKNIKKIKTILFNFKFRKVDHSNYLFYKR